MSEFDPDPEHHDPPANEQATDERPTDAGRRPPIITDPRYGFYPRWPEDGDAWVHPEDRVLARQVIPSPRIWRLHAGDGPFHTIGYGKLKLRVTPALWQETIAPECEIGDWVEVRTASHQHEPHTGRVRDIEWDDYTDEIVYLLSERGVPLPSYYRADDLRPVEPPTAIDEPIIEPPKDAAAEDVDQLVDGLPVDEHQKKETWW